ncbi:MAG: hypothetical protein ACLR8P_13845 [Clostridium fessum]
MCVRIISAAIGRTFPDRQDDVAEKIALEKTKWADMMEDAHHQYRKANGERLDGPMFGVFAHTARRATYRFVFSNGTASNMWKHHRGVARSGCQRTARRCRGWHSTVRKLLA